MQPWSRMRMRVVRSRTALSRRDALRCLAAEPGILPLPAVAADDVVAVFDRRQQLRDFLRRILQVGVERHDHLAARALERRHDRHVLAEVAVEVDDAHLFRPLLVIFPEQHQRVVAAAVVGEKNLEWLSDLVEHRGQAQEQRRQVFLFVVYRNHDAQIRLGHEPISKMFIATHAPAFYTGYAVKERVINKSRSQKYPPTEFY